MNYAEVKAQFTGLMNRRDLTANPILVDSFCQQALARAQRSLRVPAMEKQVPVTWDSTFTANKLPIPNDLLELRELVYQDSFSARTLRQEPLGTVLTRSILVSHPHYFARQGSNYLLAPTPTVGDVLTIDYYAEFPSLVVDGDSNWLTLIAPDLIVYGALAYACDYYVDGRAPAFDARFSQILQDLQGQADADELSVGAAIAPTYQYDRD